MVAGQFAWPAVCVGPCLAKRLHVQHPLQVPLALQRHVTAPPLTICCMQIGDVPLAACSYQEERQAGGGPPMYKRRMDAADGRIHLQWQAGPLQGQLQVSGATLPASTSLQQLLERLLPPSGLSLGALRLESCRLTPAQCGACPLLEPVNDLEVVYQRFLPDGHTAAEAEEFSFDGHPRPPPQGSPADLARQAALEPVLAALLAQMPRLERLHCGGLPSCVVQRTGLRSLNLNGASLETLPHGPYLQSELVWAVVGRVH